MNQLRPQVKSAVSADGLCAERVCFSCLVMICGYGVSLAIASEAIIGLANYVGPVALLITCAFSIVRLVKGNPLFLWTPLPWFLSASAVFFGLGPLVYTFGNDISVAYLRDLSPDVFRTNVLNTIGICFATGTYALVMRLFPLANQRSRDGAGNANAERAAVLFLGLGFPISYFVILPYEFGLSSFVLPGSLYFLGQLVGLGLFMLSYLSVRVPRWRPILYCAATLEITTAFLRFSKTSLLFPIIMLAMGHFMAARKISVLVRWGVVVAIVYVALCPIVSNARLRIIASVGNHYQISLRERLDVSWAALNDFALGQDQNPSEKQFWWMRLSYAHLQSYALEAYDAGHRGDTYSNAFIIFIPRVIWRDKPNMTALGVDFNEEVLGNRGSSSGCGIFAEAYWNGGWPMVGFVCAGVGALLACLSRLMIVRMARHEWLFLPCAFLGIKMGMSVDGFPVPSYIGALAIFIVYYTSIRFLYSNSTNANRSIQHQKRELAC